MYKEKAAYIDRYSNLFLVRKQLSVRTELSLLELDTVGGKQQSKRYTKGIGKYLTS